MATLLVDVRHAVRLLIKSPGFAIVAICALALGIGANTAIFSVVNTVLLKPLPYPDSERIMAVVRTSKAGESNSASIPKFMAWRKNDAFESLAVYDFAGPGLNLNGGDSPEQVKGIHVSADFFRVFGVSPVIGRDFIEEEDRPGGPRVAVLSNELWKTRFGGDPRTVGGKVSLNGEPYIVIGIMPPGYVSDSPADVWIPLQADPNSTNQGHYLKTAARLKSGVSQEAETRVSRRSSTSFAAPTPRASQRMKAPG